MVITSVILGLILAFGAQTRADQNSFEVPTLKGIDTLFVVVENLSDAAKALNLTTDVIQTDVELKLRLAGIHVVKLQVGAKLSGSPYLYVNVTATEDHRAAYVDVELDQDATLVRNSTYAQGVTTWSTGVILSNASGQDVRNYIKDHIDKFLNDWLSVNPKK